MKEIRNFVIVDDKPADIEIIEKALSKVAGCQLLFKARTEETLVHFVQSTHQPIDYLIVDLKFGNDFKKGFEIVKRIYNQYPTIKIIICSEYPDRSYLQKVIFEETTYGFIEKGSDDFAFELERAIKIIESGGAYWEIAFKMNLTLNGRTYDRQVAKRLREEHYYCLPKSERNRKNPTDMKVTPKEIRNYRYQYAFQHEYDMSAQRWLIFKNVALGYNTEEIAKRLDTPMTTINAQKSRIRAMHFSIYTTTTASRLVLWWTKRRPLICKNNYPTLR